jgi:hypothetical protein
MCSEVDVRLAVVVVLVVMGFGLYMFSDSTFIDSTLDCLLTSIDDMRQ